VIEMLGFGNDKDKWAEAKEYGINSYGEVYHINGHVVKKVNYEDFSRLGKSKKSCWFCWRCETSYTNRKTFEEDSECHNCNCEFCQKEKE